ncbi:MAG: hypothetical protein L0H53_11400 [Candidatus Nitrosocosmicus sp.]|nr:hypothetical protein [Candidatus Nitrosocosmicus sp.]MDN5868154.1 hypothetical protein [Candidatus Nitrosocosmicus sp.]
MIRKTDCTIGILKVRKPFYRGLTIIYGLKEFHISVPKVDEPSSYVNFAKIGYNPKDNSTYFYPKFFGQTGLHSSFHGSGDDHLRTHNPRFSTPLDRISLLGDIELKSRLLVRQMQPIKNTPGDIFILRASGIINDLKKSQPVKGKRLIVDFDILTKNISVIPDSRNLESSIRHLVEQGMVKKTDLILTAHQNGLGFGTSKSMFNFNPFLLNDYYKLPGVKPLVKPYSQIPNEVRQLFPTTNPFITNLNEICEKFESEINIL